MYFFKYEYPPNKIFGWKVGRKENPNWVTIKMHSLKSSLTLVIEILI